MGANTQETDYFNLIEVIQKLSLTRTIEDIARIVRVAARKLTGADGATFVLRDGDLCFYADEDAIAPLWKGGRFPMSSCISGWVMLNEQSVIIPNIYQDDRIPKDVYRPTFVKSLSMVPIRKESPIGAIGLYWASEHVSTPEEMELVQALGDSTSIAMKNIELYRELQGRVTELAKANKVKDEFLMSLSHELRTPLNAIAGWANLLSENDLPRQTAVNACQTIERNSKSLEKMVDDLLDASMIMAGKLQLDRKKIDIGLLLNDVVEGVSCTAAERFVKISLDFPDKALPEVEADQVRLLQMLGNLLSNAIKFSPVGGSVSLKCHLKGDALLFEVADEGIGLTEEQLPRVFEKFWQADSTITRRYGGLGLGLSIVKELAEAHGGVVTASSDGKDKGATFTVRLPVSSKATPFNQLEYHADPTLLLRGMRILVVDDHEDALNLLCAILEMYGAEVVAANGVSLALKHLSSDRFDLLISDLSMPEQDGFSLIRAVRSSSTYPESALPAIALTAFVDGENRKRALSAGFNAFVGKPFQAAHLAEEISKLKCS